MKPLTDINVTNETGTLRSVILGIGSDIGEPGNNNPKSKFHLDNGTFPTEDELITEITQFERALSENGVMVYRPQNINNLCQIFTRDIGFVIEDTFFISAIKESRQAEIDGVKYILDSIPQSKIVNIRNEPGNVKVEGGDVLLWDDYILVGKSVRTNDEGYEFLKNKFPDKKVVQIPVMISDDYRDNVLHLDCALQPVGANSLILYAGGIADLQIVKEILLCKNIPEENIIEVDKDQAYRMFPNIFSVSKNKVIIEKGFTELKDELVKRGIEVIEIDYASTSKLSGLLRCSTLPLERNS